MGTPVHDFSLSLGSSTVYYHVVKLESSFFVWIGNEMGTLDSMAVGVRLEAFNGDPCSTKLFGDRTAEFAESISMKLTKKTNQQVFVSSSFSSANTSAEDLQKVECRLFEELKMHPEKFL